jgi:uncharacterized protein
LNSAPIKTNGRLEIIDVWRGFAIFGIFVVNIVIMNSTFLNQDEFAKQWTSPIDQITERVLQLFFYTKFFPIFSFLFGLGIAIQAINRIENKIDSVSFFVRRMFILFIFGVYHIVFLWSGDVLNLYSILGLLTLCMISKSNGMIISLSVFFLFFPFYDQLLGLLFNLVNFKAETYLRDYNGSIMSEIIRYGTYLEGIKLRLLEYLANIPMLFGYLAPVALSMFLLGLYIGKNKIHESLEVFINRIKKPILLITILTNSYRVLFLFTLPNLDIYRSERWNPLFVKVMVLSDMAMGLFYLWLIGWLWYRTHWKVLLSPLKYVGRMALSNYIAQSFIGLCLFSSIGFKLYETLSPSQTLLTAITVFIFQIITSRIWLTYFLYGPLECIWRCFSHKKLLPIKKRYH